jgi:hypothetical protein
MMGTSDHKLRQKQKRPVQEQHPVLVFGVGKQQLQAFVMVSYDFVRGRRLALSAKLRNFRSEVITGA